MTSQELMIPVRPRTLLARYGSRLEIREYADRLQRVIWVTPPNSDTRRLSGPEALMLASAAIAHGLDPMVKDIQILFDRKGYPVLYAGPQANEKAAIKQLEEAGGGNYWPEFSPISDPAERDSLLIPSGAVAWRCRLYDSINIRTYTDAVKALAESGAKWPEIKEMLGGKPYVEGIGWYKPSEQTAAQDRQYPPTERAKKRALHAALKRRFPLPFVGETDGDTPPEFTGRFAVDEQVSAVAASERTGESSASQPASEVTVDGTARPADDAGAAQAGQAGAPPATQPAAEPTSPTIAPDAPAASASAQPFASNREADQWIETQSQRKPAQPAETRQAGQQPPAARGAQRTASKSATKQAAAKQAATKRALFGDDK